MGFNTTVVVMNDALNAIEQDVQFGPKLVQAILQMGGRSNLNEHIDVSAMGHVNAATVIESHHADGLMVVAVGGNTALNMGYGGGYTNRELQVLNVLAERLGYTLHKKPKKRKRANGVP